MRLREDWWIWAWLGLFLLLLVHEVRPTSPVVPMMHVYPTSVPTRTPTIAYVPGEHMTDVRRGAI
jgi:hypothetical protein